MLRALEIDPPDADQEPFRQVVRANLHAWGARAATLLYTFRLPGSNPSERRIDANGKGLVRQLFVSRVGDHDRFVTIGDDRIARQWSFASGNAAGPDFPLAALGYAMSVSGDGERLAITGPKNQIQNLGTGRTVPAPVHQHEKNGGRRSL